MVSVVLILLTAFSILPLTNQTPQIFEDKETCKISYKYQKKIIQYKVPLYITAEDHDLLLLFSLCGHLPTVFPNNGSCSKTCLYNKHSQSLITAKSNKIPFEVEEHLKNQITLILKDKLKCTAERDYEVTVKMVELDSLLKKPRLTVENECDIIVEMLKPDYEPPCTYLLSSKDLINLKPMKGHKISIPWEGKEYKIALCGGNRDCGTGNSGCIKEGNDMIILGTTISQKVRFDTDNNDLKVVASYSEGRKKMRTMEIILKCNWDVPTFSNAKFIKPSKQGRNHQFEVESSFGCVKIQSDCRIKDKSNGFTYDLTGLSNRTGSKVMLNSTKFILINICGDLQGIGTRGNNCERGHSQVCEINKDLYTNKGSIPTFEITDQHSIKVVLKEGQKCNENVSYSTVIDIKCSFDEKGPIFVKNENCVTTLLWETPRGCPKYKSEADSCIVSTFLGGINISNLYGENDRIHSFSTSDKFIFNVCGKIHSNCSSHSDASACYITSGTQQIIGWNSPKLLYTNGKLQLKYYGEKCQTENKLSSLTINLYCSYASNPTETKLNKRDSCTFEASIYSLSACLSQQVEDCTYENPAVKYDLTPLIAKEINYKVQDQNDKKVIYFLNICRPLVNENGLIPGNSMIYSMDKSKPHIWDRFTSLGKIGRPILTNDRRLMINSILGRSCAPGRDYSSEISFECSDKNEGPKLLEKKDCHFQFLWRTQYACPAIKPGGSCVLSGEISAQVPSDEIKIERGENMYGFSLCDENYVTCNRGSCIKDKLTQRLWEQDRKVHIEVKFANSLECTKNSLKTVNLTVDCDPNSRDLLTSTISQNTCHVDLLLKTALICPSGKELAIRELNHVQHDTSIMPNIETNTLNKKPIAQKEEYPPEVVRLKINSNSFGSSSNSKNDTGEKFSEMKELDVPIKEFKIPDHVEQLINEKELNNNESKMSVDKAKVQQNTGFETSLEDSPVKSMGSQYQKCNTVNIGTKTFNVNDIESSKIIGTDTYTINFNGNSSNCGGRICKNARPILYFIEDCPQVLYSENLMLLSYTVEEECLSIDNLTQSSRTANSKIEIALKCNETSHKMTVSERTNCIIRFEYNSPQICDLVKNTNKSSLIATSVGVAFVVISMLILGFVLYSRNHKRCSYNSVSNPESSYINHSKLL